MSAQPRAGLPPIPARMQRLPLDARGYPIPWFVETLEDGSRDFRIASGEKAERARRDGNCWVCGEICGRLRTFVVGPMCAVNRTTSEPACHLECAQFSVTACPFLTLPKAKRNEHALPDGIKPSLGPTDGVIARNPGVSCLWTTGQFWIWRAGDGMLYRLGEPNTVSWWAEKRQATREECLASIDSGMPILREKAALEGQRALDGLAVAYQRMLAYLPPG